MQPEIAPYYIHAFKYKLEYTLCFVISLSILTLHAKDSYCNFTNVNYSHKAQYTIKFKILCYIALSISKTHKK